jgi:hypothetical protein
MNELVFALTLFVLNPAPGPVNGVEPRSHYELAAYTSRTEFEINARIVKIDVKAARLRCIPRVLSPDEKRLIAIAEGRWL